MYSREIFEKVSLINKGEKKLNFEGKWNEYGSFIDTEGNLKINEKVNENMKDFEKYYYFCEETVDLNNLTPKMLEYLPPTDSWLRPD